MLSTLDTGVYGEKRERREDRRQDGRVEPKWYEYLDGCVPDPSTYATCMRGNNGPEVTIRSHPLVLEHQCLPHHQIHSLPNSSFLNHRTLNILISCSARFPLPTTHTQGTTVRSTGIQKTLPIPSHPHPPVSVSALSIPSQY